MTNGSIQLIPKGTVDMDFMSTVLQDFPDVALEA
jgi:hypothetical protein